MGPSPTDKTALSAKTVTFAGHGGDEVEGYLATPEGGVRGGVVVIHHMPGYDGATKEIVRRFAADAIHRALDAAPAGLASRVQP